MAEEYEETVGYTVRDDEIAGRIACTRMLGCAVVVHTDSEARRIRDHVAKIGGEVPEIRVRSVRASQRFDRRAA